MKFARYPEVKAVVVDEFVSLIDGDGQHGLAALPGAGALVSNKVVKVRMGKTVIDSILQQKRAEIKSCPSDMDTDY